jgi:hypothetical protein
MPLVGLVLEQRSAQRRCCVLRRRRRTPTPRFSARSASLLISLISPNWRLSR